MKILILAAMEKELSLLSGIRNKHIPHEVIIAKCGIGKVNAALNCQKLIDLYTPDLVLNSGVAGGAGLPVGTVLVADRVTYDDVWCGPGTEYGQADGYPLFMLPSEKIMNLAENLDPRPQKGLICTGDKFISTPEEISFIKSKFPDVKAVDMESAAIAQTCIHNDTDFAIIRVVSDTPGENDNISQYKDFWTKAPEKNFIIIQDIIKRL